MVGSQRMLTPPNDIKASDKVVPELKTDVLPKDNRDGDEEFEMLMLDGSVRIQSLHRKRQ